MVLIVHETTPTILSIILELALVFYIFVDKIVDAFAKKFLILHSTLISITIWKLYFFMADILWRC